MKVLVFTGAGSSVELGIPAMYHMARAFRRHVEDWNVEADFVRSLMAEDSDLEELIEKLDPICAASESLRNLGHDDGIFDRARSVQAEVEWYVQHTCERLTPELALLQWGPLLKAAEEHQLVIATTNYDRAVELAANSLNLDVTDGFDRFGNSEIANWTGLEDPSGFGPVGAIRLLKLHGSTDWYEMANSGEPIKLRHPMPLFANATLQLPRIENSLRASLILPARAKQVAKLPYVRLTQAFLNASDQCDIALYLGTSLRDHHIRQAAGDSSKTRSTFVISRSRLSLAPPEVINISQSASRFLVATLPAALASDDPVSRLRGESDLAEASGSSMTECILPYLGAALDDTLLDHERCRGIERLEGLGISLDTHTLEKLLASPSNMVARFALGLMPLSTKAKTLLEIAKQRSDISEDPEYQDELQILELLLAS